MSDDASLVAIAVFAGSTVVCIACGETVSRSAAREYDKFGDRWEREGKQFEFLCKPCDRSRCNRSRNSLEETLIAAGAGEVDRATFLRSFFEGSEHEASSTRSD